MNQIITRMNRKRFDRDVRPDSNTREFEIVFERYIFALYYVWGYCGGSAYPTRFVFSCALILTCRGGVTSRIIKIMFAHTKIDPTLPTIDLRSC
jgi:hypothetical protein